MNTLLFLYSNSDVLNRGLAFPYLECFKLPYIDKGFFVNTSGECLSFHLLNNLVLCSYIDSGYVNFRGTT